MSKSVTGSVCLNHPDVPAVTRCAACSKPICAACVVKHDGVSYCSKACRDNAIRTGVLVEDVNVRKAKSDCHRRKIAMVMWILFLVVVVLAVWLYRANKSKIDRMIHEEKQKIEQKTDSVKQKGQNLIHDSKFKKQREQLVK